MTTVNAKGLNDQYAPQERYRAVVDHGNGLLVVIAGPGTGKTFSLLRRIENLIARKAPPGGIYYLTFVNSIVDAFRADAAKSADQGGLGMDPAELGINIMTLHSLAFKIVSSYAKKIRLPSHVELLDLNPRSSSLLSHSFLSDLYVLAKGSGICTGKRQFDKLLQSITVNWRNGIPSPADASELEKLLFSIVKTYQAFPWDYLVLLANKIVAKYGLPQWLQQGDHFLVDEYQDFNPPEQELIRRITEPSDSLIIVGDPNQSIYGGRQASPQGLQDLLAEEAAYYVTFTHCRRSPRAVIDAANNLLQHMVPDDYAEQALQYFKPEAGIAVLREVKSCKAEIEFIAKSIHRLEELGQVEVVLLFPTKVALDFYYGKLRAAGVDCRTRDVQEANELVEACLRLVLLRHQPLLERVVLSHFGHLQEKYQSAVLEGYVESGGPFLERLADTLLGKPICKKCELELQRLTTCIEGLTSGDIGRVILALSELGIVIEVAVVEGIIAADQNKPIRLIIAEVIRSKKEQREVTEDSDVLLLTMHSAKGLSKRSVIVPAFEDRWVPGAKTGAVLAEQNRLMYVAVTRAREHLLVIWPKTRAKGDPLNYLPQGTQPGVSRYGEIMFP